MTTIPTEAFPLSWPLGVPRTRRPLERTPFQRGHTVARGFEETIRQLRLMGAATIVVSSNLALKPNGEPRSESPRTDDHGVAVYWTVAKHGSAPGPAFTPHVMPCDKWSRIEHNLHAIGLSIAALRGVERWGAVRLEQAFAGFAALPPGAGGAGVTRPWRDVLCVTGDWMLAAPAAAVLAFARTQHRALLQRHHPDRGGSHEAAIELNVALEQAEAELGEATPA